MRSRRLRECSEIRKTSDRSDDNTHWIDVSEETAGELGLVLGVRVKEAAKRIR